MTSAYLTTDNDTHQLPKQKCRVVFAGTPDFAAVSLKALIEQQDTLGIEIVAVYTQPDRKAGRGQKLSTSAVKQVAIDYDIAIEQPVTFKKSCTSGIAARETLRSYQPDVMIVAAYGLILPIGVLNIPTHGCLNIHASLLPRWRGAAPIHRALLAGDDQTGITIMQMDKGLDTGDMLYKVACDISATDTAASLHDKLADLGADAIVTVIKDLTQYQTRAIAQDHNQANYAEKLIKSEGEIDWSQSAAHIERHIRGLNPWPGAYTFLDGQRVKILDASIKAGIKPAPQALRPNGTIISVGRKAILVACGNSDDEGTDTTDALAITHLQFAGGKPINAEQVCHGNQLADGDRFTRADLTS